jgi:hypothetical protein
MVRAAALGAVILAASTPALATDRAVPVGFSPDGKLAAAIVVSDGGGEGVVTGQLLVLQTATGLPLDKKPFELRLDESKPAETGDLVERATLELRKAAAAKARALGFAAWTPGRRTRAVSASVQRLPEDDSKCIVGMFDRMLVNLLEGGRTLRALEVCSSGVRLAGARQFGGARLVVLEKSAYAFEGVDQTAIVVALRSR